MAVHNFWRTRHGGTSHRSTICGSTRTSCIFDYSAVGPAETAGSIVAAGSATAIEHSAAMTVTVIGWVHAGVTTGGWTNTADHGQGRQKTHANCGYFDPFHCIPHDFWGVREVLPNVLALISVNIIVIFSQNGIIVKFCPKSCSYWFQFPLECIQVYMRSRRRCRRLWKNLR